MRSLRVPLLCAALLPTAAGAAECTVYRSRIDFENEMLVRMLAQGGEDCRVQFTPGEQFTADVNEIVERPHHGGARVHGTSSAYYRSNPGYRGPDRFAFQFCGRNAGKPACATVQVKVNVR